MPPLAIIETVNDIRYPDPNTGIDRSEHAFCLHYFINFFFRQLGAMIKPIYESLTAHPIGGNSSMTSAFTRSSDSNSIDQPRSVVLGNISKVKLLIQYHNTLCIDISKVCYSQIVAFLVELNALLLLGLYGFGFPARNTHMTFSKSS